MKKYYAKQIDPEHQESYLFFDEGILEGICYSGNKNYFSRTTELFDEVTKLLNDGDLAYELQKFRDGDSEYFDTELEVLDDYIRTPIEVYKDKSTELAELFLDFNVANRREEDEIICNIMSILDNTRWDYTTIRGCCQGDWQQIYYNTEMYSDESIKSIEIQYFNLGSEWIVHDENTEVTCADDISGYGVYLLESGYDVDDTKKELSEYVGCQPDELVMYFHKGYTRNSIYEEA